jgi:hypothetical protein
MSYHVLSLQPPALTNKSLIIISQILITSYPQHDIVDSSLVFVIQYLVDLLVIHAAERCYRSNKTKMAS